jgi:hypothetical protein
VIDDLENKKIGLGWNGGVPPQERDVTVQWNRE